jgi:sugar-specific transcriptional regulator TrmB
MTLDETPQQRESKAVQLAEARGRRQQEVDGRLDGHDERFDRLNGSIDRAARAQEHLGEKVAAVENGLKEVLAKMKTAEAVSSVLAKSAQDAVSKQLSRREFWLGVAAITAALLGPHLGSL